MFSAILCVAAAFIDVTLVKTDGRPPAAHNVILRAVKQLLRKFGSAKKGSEEFLKI